MRDAVTIGLAGIGGCGDGYLTALFDKLPAGGLRLVGCVDPYPQACRRLADLARLRVPIFDTLDGLFQHTAADLMILSTPPHLHVEQIARSLAAGANVLCEKPLASTVEDGLRAIRAEREFGGFVGIGYQWSFSKAIGALKRDLMAGKFGQPLRFASMAIYPRGRHYYARNAWAGRERTDAGVPIFDSPANNATAHFLHNMLFLLGDTRTTSALPAMIEAELYRANPIESYDTAVIRGRTTAGTQLVFATSHAGPDRVGPLFRLECEHADVTYGEEPPFDRIVARYHDGYAVPYGQPEQDREEKLWQSIAATSRGGVPTCGVRAAIPHAVCIAAARMSSEPTTIAARHITELVASGGRMVVVKEMEPVLKRCYASSLLPSELGIPWARRGRPITLDQLLADSFPPTSAASRELVRQVS